MGAWISSREPRAALESAPKMRQQVSLSEIDCFTEKLNDATKGKFQITMDGFPANFDTIHTSLGTRVDYAQLIKVYGAPTEDEHRYSPAKVIEAIAKPVWGTPEGQRICTSHVERQNLSIRMGMRRMTRLTNAFSKKWENLKAAYGLWFVRYNFCRVHQTLRVTPRWTPDLPIMSGP